MYSKEEIQAMQYIQDFDVKILNGLCLIVEAPDFSFIGSQAEIDKALGMNKKRYCEYCGARVKDNAINCPDCGSKLN